jgi:hypothetical protein
MLLILRGAEASDGGVGFTHIGTFFRRAVIMRAGEMINARLHVHPNDGSGTAVAFSLGFGLILVRGSRCRMATDC